MHQLHAGLLALAHCEYFQLGLLTPNPNPNPNFQYPVPLSLLYRCLVCVCAWCHCVTASHHATNVTTTQRITVAVTYCTYTHYEFLTPPPSQTACDNDHNTSKLLPKQHNSSVNVPPLTAMGSKANDQKRPCKLGKKQYTEWEHTQRGDKNEVNTSKQPLCH